MNIVNHEDRGTRLKHIQEFFGSSCTLSINLQLYQNRAIEKNVIEQHALGSCAEKK